MSDNGENNGGNGPGGKAIYSFRSEYEKGEELGKHEVILIPICNHGIALLMELVDDEPVLRNFLEKSTEQFVGNNLVAMISVFCCALRAAQKVVQLQVDDLEQILAQSPVTVQPLLRAVIDNLKNCLTV